MAPTQTLQAWDRAEARLFPLIMARPQDYERALLAVQQLLQRLRSTCPDIPTLLAANERGTAILAASTVPGHPAASVLADGLPTELIAAAACAARYRELAAAQAAAARLAAFTRARGRPGTWAVIEEAGALAQVPYQPYQRIETHVPTGRAVVVSIEPDETLSHAVWRLDEAALDTTDGRLTVGEAIGSYDTAARCEEALAAVRARMT